MNKANWIPIVVGLVILVAVAYGASAFNRFKWQAYVAKLQQESFLDAEFAHPNGWQEVARPSQATSWIAFDSPDLKYVCSDGAWYTSAQISEMTDVDFPADGICFRPPLIQGSELSVANNGDMGMSDYTLETIPYEWTDGNQRNSIKNQHYIKVDGYDAVMWEDSYGDSVVSRQTVAIIRDHKVYEIRQMWPYNQPNPYPALMGQVIKSFKFTD